MRLRVIDLSTWWFWVVVFYRRQYGEPLVELQLYGPTPGSRWWLHLWMWEPIPATLGAVEVILPEEARDG